MSASAALLLLAAAAAAQNAGPATHTELAAHCAGEDGWEAPAPPARIHGSTYYVGTCGIAAILIAGDEGHLLIDASTPGAAPLIAANIARLGFRIADVRLILSSHEHVDHAGGIAELQRLSGATVAVRAAALGGFATGASVPGDPQHGGLPPFPPPRIGRILGDGETVALGALRLTAHATPGHTPGGTSWTWRSCEGEACRDIVFADSVTPVAARAFRFSTRPAYVAAYRESLARIAALPCDMLLTPHPGASAMFDRMAAGRLEDAGACRAYARSGTARLDARLAEEAGR